MVVTAVLMVAIVAAPARAARAESGGSLESVPPARLLDTRPGARTVDGLSVGSGRVAAGTEVAFTVAGRGGVPSDASAALLNVTVVNPSAAGFVTVHACADARPTASNVNYRAAQVVPNAVLAKIGTDGRVCVFTLAEAHIVVDVNGFVPAAGSPIPIAPIRVLETRQDPALTTIDGEGLGAGRVAAGGVQPVKVVGRGEVPADASAVLVNLTAVNPSASGFLTVFPCGEPIPTASSLNYDAGENVANAVLARVGAGGEICVYSLVDTHVVIDVNGVVPAGGSPVSVTPARLLDSRTGPDARTVDGGYVALGRLPAGMTAVVRVAGRGPVPADASAVFLNVTAVNPSAAGFLTVFSCDVDDVPGSSNVNYGPGEIVPNAVFTEVSLQSDSGSICIYSLAETEVVVDVVGFVGARKYATFGRWDPCVPIRYVVDPTRATPQMRAELDAAIAEVERVTGLDFQPAGTYTATYTLGKPNLPVGAHAAFTFADDDLVPEFGIAGLGVTYSQYNPADGEIVTGITVVDPTPISGATSLLPVLLHEIGHMVGLDHVNDPTQLMYPADVGNTGFGDGDLAGLRHVGAAQGCMSGRRAFEARDEALDAGGADRDADRGVAGDPDLITVVHDGFDAP